MENNISSRPREKIFALYYDQCILQKQTYDCILVIPSVLMSINAFDYHLLVTPLSMITDEDAIQVAKMNRSVKEGDVNLPGLGKDREAAYGRNNIYFLIHRRDTADFLRSRGYALPAFGYTVDQLVQAGVFTLKTTPQ